MQILTHLLVSLSKENADYSQYKHIEFVQVSDIHGWVGGHADAPLYGDFGTLQSYIDRVNENISTSPTSSIFVVDGGDLVEGTIYSEGTQIHGQAIYDLASEIPFNLLTIGNHDIGDKDRIDYLYNNMQELFGDRFVTTNIYTKDDANERIGEAFNYQVLSNGLRVLSFGFQYYSSTTVYAGGQVVEPLTSAKSKEIEDIVDQYGDDTDVLVLDNHIGIEDSVVPKLYQVFRNYFNEKFNHEVPIIIVNAHDHMEVPYDRYGNCNSDDYNCYDMDAGKYLQYINHVSFTFGFDETNNNKSYMEYHWYYSPQYFEPTYIASNGTDTGLAQRFNLTADEFDTPAGLEIRQQVFELGIRLGVNETIGYANQTYRKSGSIYQNDSMVYLYMYGVMKDVVLRNDTELPQQAMVCTGSFRGDLEQGNITNDDAYQTMPFFNTIQYFKNMSCPLFNCIMDAMNGGSSSNPYYTQYADCEEQNWPFMDVVSDDYYAPRMNTYMDQCNASEQVIYNYSVATAGIDTSFDAYLYYIKNFMQLPQEEEEQQPEEEEQNKSNNDSLSSSTIAVICVCSILGAVVIAALIYFSIRHYRNKQDKYEAIVEQNL